MFVRLFTVLYFSVRSSIRAAILHDCQNYLGGGGSRLPPPTAKIPNVRPLRTFKNQDGRH